MDALFINWNQTPKESIDFTKKLLTGRDKIFGGDNKKNYTKSMLKVVMMVEDKQTTEEA